MEEKSMTALISAFSRAYHSINNEVKVFDDFIAKKLLTNEEYSKIAKSMCDGIAFFNPQFKGEQQALRWIVDNQLSPSPLGRAAFSEEKLEQTVSMGAKQFLIFGAGYDTFAYRQPLWANKLEIFEIDRPATVKDKLERLNNAGIIIPDNVHYINADFTKRGWQDTLLHNRYFDANKISCCNALGVAYYLSKETFNSLISVVSEVFKKGSSVIFDYPDENSYTESAGERAKNQFMLAGAAKEEMKASYSYSEMERLLSDNDFLAYEHLTPLKITDTYFKEYNMANPKHTITAFDNVNYCFAVIK